MKIKQSFDGLLIRLATIHDAPQISLFNQKMAKETEGRVLSPDISLAGVKAVFKDRHKGFYLVAETQDADAGIIGQLLVTYEWSDWRNRYYWWIQSVYVKPEFRGQKVFSHLYRHLEEEARYRRDVAGLRLYVERQNRPAKDAYEKIEMTLSAYDMYEIDFYS